MGYTHYWTWKITPDPKKLQKCMEAMVPVINDQIHHLAGPDGQGEPEIEGAILFNGKGEAPDELAHEAFWFPGDLEVKRPYTMVELNGKRTVHNPTGFNFCKTARKPYDAAVTACLLIARDFFSPEELRISSDGSWREEWTKGADYCDGRRWNGYQAEAGANVYQRVTGQRARSPFAKSSKRIA